jgi:hypothetical protein
VYTVNHNLKFGSIGMVRAADYERLKVHIHWAIFGSNFPQGWEPERRTADIDEGDEEDDDGEDQQ